jgi:hypothetical protein
MIVKVVLALLALGSAPCVAQELHVFQIYDTNDPAVGKLIERASADLDYFFTNVVPAALPNHQLNSHFISGDDFSIDTLRATVNNMGAFGENDIVLLFYLGHGFDDPESSLQMLNLPDLANDTGTYPAQRIVDALWSRSPALLIAIFEACNVSSPGLLQEGGGTTYVFDTERVQSVLSMKAGLAVASSSEGQFSLIGLDGGLFSRRMLGFFSEAASQVPADLEQFKRWIDSPLAALGYTQDPLVLEATDQTWQVMNSDN